jgi:hypothetical protein
MGIVTFTKAQRTGSHVIISIVGESGSGKTYSAILLGRGLVGPKGRLAMLDTESGRGKMYSHLAGGYDYGELTPQFTPERYIESIQGAQAAGYDALIIDSGSHEWEGIGGVLEDADAGKDQQGNALTGLVKWAKPKARHKKFVQCLLNTRMHLIICLRAKERLVQVTNNGKKEIVSAGFVPVQDKRFVYETTVQLFLPQGSKGVAHLDKCPEDLLGAFPANKAIDVDTGGRIAEWVSGGVPVDHAYEALRAEAMEAAEGGREVMRAFWLRISKPQKEQLVPLIENLKSIADQADRDALEEKQKPAPTTFEPAQTTTQPADGELNDSLEGLFDDAGTDKVAAE